MAAASIIDNENRNSTEYCFSSLRKWKKPQIITVKIPSINQKLLWLMGYPERSPRYARNKKR